MTERIADGSTRLLGIVGDPIRQVRAPEVWSALFRTNGANAVCIPLHVAPADLEAFVTGLKTIRNVAGLLGAGQRVSGRRALVVSSGGVGTAIAFAVADAGAASVHVADIAPDRTAGLACRIEAAGTPSGVSPAAARGFDLVVNASPVGMRETDAIAIDPDGLEGDALAGDVVVHPPLTPWLAAARARGCHVQPGTVMMDNQLMAMRDFFRFPDGDYSPARVAQVVAQVTAT